MKIKNLYLIYKKIYVNLLSPFALVILLMNENPESIYLILLSIIIHEIGHFLGIKIFNVKIDNIKIEPFGVTISINKYTNYKKEILVASFGPLNGFFVATLCLFLQNKYPSVYIFYFMILNISYSIINIIPCEFLDGGLIVKSILFLFLDTKKAYKITEMIYRISSVTIIILMILSCYYVNFNVSLTTISIFILIIFPHKNKSKYI